MKNEKWNRNVDEQNCKKNEKGCFSRTKKITLALYSEPKDLGLLDLESLESLESFEFLELWLKTEPFEEKASWKVLSCPSSSSSSEISVSPLFLFLEASFSFLSSSSVRTTSFPSSLNFALILWRFLLSSLLLAKQKKQGFQDVSGDQKAKKREGKKGTDDTGNSGTV